MGRITEALKKVGEEGISRVQKGAAYQYIVKTVENSSIDQHIVAFHDPTSPAAEEYKILRTNLQALKYEKDIKAFMITSAIHGEGKTVTSINTAITLAHELNGKSVLLIDADLRKGSVARYLGIKGRSGLSEFLRGTAEPDDIVVCPGIDNLAVMFAGEAPRNPSELLNSKKMQQLIAAMKTRYDYIIIDTPPVIPVTDACILGSMVDGVIVVFQSGRTQKDLMKAVKQRLTQARAATLGYIMTGIEAHLPDYLYRHTYGYKSYAEYYKIKSKKRKSPSPAAKETA